MYKTLSALVCLVSPLAASCAGHASQTIAVPAPSANRQRAEGVVESIGYAQAIQVGNTIYLSGAVARGATMDEQVAGAYRSIARTLGNLGASLDDVVKETVYTTDMEALKAANPARRAAYGAHIPAATWVQISRLYLEAAKVEIEVTAVIGSGRP